jgi:hypothetical protein
MLPRIACALFVLIVPATALHSGLAAADPAPADDAKPEAPPPPRAAPAPKAGVAQPGEDADGIPDFGAEAAASSGGGGAAASLQVILPLAQKIFTAPATRRIFARVIEEGAQATAGKRGHLALGFRWIRVLSEH